MTKMCNDCRQVKPAVDFYARRDRPGGLKPYCKPCTSLRYQNRKAKYEPNRDATRANWRKFKYGITAEEYQQKLDAQDGLCAICNGPQVSDKALAVDHNHETGAVRDLLCNSCNGGLGLFKDSPALLDRAAEYLRKHSI